MEFDNDEIVTDHYRVNHYRQPGDRLIVCFTSMAGNGVGENNEEFRHTLRELGVSSIHVTARAGDWYNNPQTEAVLNAVARRSEEYAHIGVTGQSMGASGAILFTRFRPHISRVLAFAPQYAVTRPFIDFDERYAGQAAALERHYHLDFGRSPITAHCQLIYGNLEWRDYLHGAMFAATGYPVTTIDGGTHEVAAYLKWSPQGNLLRPLMTRFCDFEQGFDTDCVRSILAPLVTDRVIQPGRATVWRQSFARQHPPRVVPPAPDGLINLALHQSATQSSASPWSRHANPAEDAGGAVSGSLTGGASFHTNYETDPWWQVDLGGRCAVQKVRVFNNLTDFDAACRANLLRAQVAESPDGPWQDLFQRSEAEPFGGVDGYPLIWRGSHSRVFRLLRLTLLGSNCLHLDQIEVYGRMLPPRNSA